MIREAACRELSREILRAINPSLSDDAEIIDMLTDNIRRTVEIDELAQRIEKLQEAA